MGYYVAGIPYDSGLSVGSSMTVTVDSAYMAQLADSGAGNGFSDGVLDANEIAGDADAAALAASLQAAICANLGISDCSTVIITGLGHEPSVVSGVTIGVTQAYHDVVISGDADGAWLCGCCALSDTLMQRCCLLLTISFECLAEHALANLRSQLHISSWGISCAVAHATGARESLVWSALR